MRLPKPAVLATAAAAPVAVCVALPRTRTRDVATCALQMWAYLAAYEMPHDDPEALARRVRIDYPVQRRPRDRARRPADAAPAAALPRPARSRALEKVLVWTHWLWFARPACGDRVRARARPRALRPRGRDDLRGLRPRRRRLLAAADRAALVRRREGRLGDDRTPAVRRMMVEYGEQFWKHRWGAALLVLGGNPLAAMPSLHFATSVNAAHLLAESGPVEGAVGWTYALTLGRRARLPGRALRRRPARGARADRARARARAAARAGARRRPASCRRSRRRRSRLMARTPSSAPQRGSTSASTAPLVEPHATPARRPHDEEEMPRVALTRRARDPVRRLRARVDRVPVLRAAADRRREGHAATRVSRRRPAWLAAALGFELLSFASYVALFHGVHVPPGSPLTARQLPDHDGRPRGDAAVRGGAAPAASR